jgi:hypothetical protein
VVVLLVAAGAVLVLSEAPLCPTAFLFGIPCPGCGLTRATLALLHGHVSDALRFHPLVFVLAPLFGGALGSSLYAYLRGPSLTSATRRPGAFPPAWWTRSPGIALASLLGVLVVGVWLARFAGYFGGPVPVENYRAWATRHTAR